MSDTVAIIGAGAWGTALAVHLARVAAPPALRLWARDPAAAHAIAASRENARYLPGIAHSASRSTSSPNCRARPRRLADRRGDADRRADRRRAGLARAYAARRWSGWAKASSPRPSRAGRRAGAPRHRADVAGAGRRDLRSELCRGSRARGCRRPSASPPPIPGSRNRSPSGCAATRCAPTSATT